MAEALPMGLAGVPVTLCAGLVTCAVVSGLEVVSGESFMLLIT